MSISALKELEIDRYSCALLPGTEQFGTETKGRVELSSNPNRRGFLLACLAISGCGFEPVYGPGGGQVLRNAVLVRAPVNNDEFEFVRAIELQLGQPGQQAFTLSYSLSISNQLSVVSSAQELTRFSTVGTATYELKDMSGAVVKTGSVDAFTSYSATGSTLSTNQSQNDARRRLIVILADKLVTQLSANIAQ